MRAWISAIATCALLTSACSAGTTAPTRDSHAGVHVTGLTGQTLYLLVGPAAFSANVWRVPLAGGSPSQITHNREQFGVSWLSASPAGVVVADARTGIDNLGVLKANTVSLLPDGHVGGPAISDTGQIAYVRPPEVVNPTGPAFFTLEVKPSLDRQSAVLYEQRAPALGNPVWIANGAIAVSSGEPAPAGRPASSGDVLILDGNGRVLARWTLRGIAAPFALVGRQSARSIAAVGFDNTALLLDPATGAQSPLPGHWRPLCWSPDGMTLWSFALLGVVKGECETWVCAFRSGN
jgi:hypothetical protein